MSKAIVWFRRDLRLADHPALEAAARRGPIVPVFIFDDRGDWAPGAASKWWLGRALESLADSLGQRGSRLVIRRGDPKRQLAQLIDETGAEAVYANRTWRPDDPLSDLKAETRRFNGSLLHEPGEVLTQQGGHYTVFTPFYRACMKRLRIGQPLDAPAKLPSPEHWPKSLDVDDLKLNPTIDGDAGLRDAWTVSEQAAHDRLNAFIARGDVSRYDGRRDRPALDGTSRLSPYLAWGQITPRQIWYALRRCEDAEPFRRQLVWREFAYQLLHHQPQTTDRPLRQPFADFPWVDMRQGRHWLDAWTKGQTGYPIVDAGMRQLWRTGWMHNRVRMIVGSFLVKDLRIHWREGARWFWDTLVDADLANNTLGWQWIAGCGADAAPYFRIFNPTRQSRKFDPDGHYLRRWCEELRDVEAPDIHDPPPEVRRETDYPPPVIDHGKARDEALAAYQQMKR